MPKVIVYVPAAAWKKLEERGLDPAVAVREFAKRGYELNDGQLSERDLEAVGMTTTQPEEVGRISRDAEGPKAQPPSPRSESRPAPANCGMSNRHHMNSKQNPCPRCGYPA